MKKIILIILSLITINLKSQVVTSAINGDLMELKYDHQAEEKFGIYVEMNHQMDGNFTTWKSENKIQYLKELWYQSKSFYIKRNVNSEGITMNEALIDIGRFESSRLIDSEAIVNIPGFKDVIVLLPTNKLIYKP